MTMYRHVIEIQKETPKDILATLIAIADNAFDNRVGKVRNVSDLPYKLVYEGGENEFGCLDLGMLALEKDKMFLNHVISWQWIDEEEPDESCDILEVFSRPVR